jgi:hypothetical protein
MVDGKLREEAGSHIPVAITFDVLNGKNSLREYWTPRDGTYYASDIRDKFPNKIEDEAMNTQKYIAAQKQECYVQAMRNNGIEVSDPDQQSLPAKEQAAAISFGAKEKVQSIFSDANAVKELSIGIEELKAMPEVEGSILYTMEHESMINNLKSLMLFISDRRLDDASVEEEIRRVMEKVKPAGVVAAEAGQAEAAVQAQDADQAVGLAADGGQEAAPEMSAEEQAIENAKIIAYGACTRAIEALG